MSNETELIADIASRIAAGMLAHGYVLKATSDTSAGTLALVSVTMARKIISTIRETESKK